MLITNKYNLPPAFFNVLTSGSHAPVRNRFSVTDLVGAPRQRMLKMIYWDVLEQDISDMLWMLLGKSVHYILEGGAPKESLAEEKLTMGYDDSILVGVADLYHESIISDTKVTSVYSFLLGDKPEWERQLNLYAFMFMHVGLPVKALRIDAILRDWQKSKSLREEDYPPIPFQSVTVPFWGYEDAQSYLILRHALHRAAEGDTEDMLDPCTPEEMWERPTTYAVMKNGAKRALRVLNSMEEAADWVEMSADDPKKCTIEERKGERAKCKDYCLVRNVCDKNIYREAL
jgi:hypothetical protein